MNIVLSDIISTVILGFMLALVVLGIYIVGYIYAEVIGWVLSRLGW